MPIWLALTSPIAPKVLGPWASFFVHLCTSLFLSGTVPSGGIAAFMKRAVIKANRAFAMGVAENDVLPQQPPLRGESAGEFLRALRDTRAKIHVDLGPKIKASWVVLIWFLACLFVCLCQAASLELYAQSGYPSSIPTDKLAALVEDERQRLVVLSACVLY
jgi:hypothetical protein